MYILEPLKYQSESWKFVSEKGTTLYTTIAGKPNSHHCKAQTKPDFSQYLSLY